MSTLKTNNIEHLDASTPSIQTTIGGGTILAGVSTVSGALNVGSGTSISSPATNTLTLGTNSVERLRIASDGSVGIGENNPAAKLHVQVASGEVIRASASGANQHVWARFIAGSPSNTDLRIGADSASGGVYGVGGGAVVWNAGNGPLAFGTNNIERLRITSAGLVGIGTNNPSNPLEVHSDGATNIVAKSNNGNGGFLNYSGLSNTGTTTFSVNHNGMIYTAGGLNFGTATSPVTSQTLDDYEEGSWTPVIKSGTNLISYTGGNQVFRYTKIGDTVHLWFDMDGSTTSGTTGQAWSIEGLPFASNDTTGYRTVGTLIYWYGTGLQGDAWPAAPHIGANSTTLQVYQKANAGASYGNTNVSAVGASSYVFFELTYKT